MTVQMEPVNQTVLDAALVDVKSWLRIETVADDASLFTLIAAAIACAEQFCNQILVQRAGIELLDVVPGWTRLRATPFVSMSQLRLLPDTGGPVTLSILEYAVELDASGDAFLRLFDPGIPGRLEGQLVAGIASSWIGLPEALRQGIVRLAAHLFSERDSDAPPAIVTALLAPYRRMRLS